MKNKLREKREALNLRMIDIALICGVGISTIWLVENGYDRRISKKTKEKITKGLGVTTKEIFPEE